MVFKENILTEEECCNLLKIYLNHGEFKVLEYEETTWEEFDGYFKIKIKILNDAQSEVEFIGKNLQSCPKNNSNEKEIFSHETLYTGCNFKLKHYYTKKNKFMIFENVCKEDFIQPRVIDVDHIKLTLINIAKMHAKSIEFESNMSNKDAKYYQIINEHEYFKNDELMNSGWFGGSLKNLSVFIDLLPEKLLDSKQFQTRITEIFQKFHNNNSGGLFKKVLCHGGLWDKNILFRYDNQMKPIECKFINFEYQQYNSPVIDVLQCIYMNTNQEMRKQNLHELLDHYYECLRDELKIKGFNLEQILSKKEDYEIALHHFLPLIKLQMACLKQPTYLNNKSTNNSPEEFKTNDCVNRSLNESIMELHDLITHPGLTMEDCFKIIRNKIGERNYKLVNYKIIPLGKISGYLGDHNKLKIVIMKDNKAVTLNLFAKFMPKVTSSIAIEKDTNAFYKEISFYQTFLPIYEDLGIELIKECVSECYFARHKDVLVFDDLEMENYLCLEPRKPIDFKCAKMIIEKIAKFHASNIILEERIKEKMNCPEYSLLDDFSKELEESLFTLKESHQGGQCVKIGLISIDCMLELFPNTNKNISLSDEEMKIKMEKAFKAIYEIVKPSKEFRNVLSHGDLWIANMLIKCLDGQPIDCRFIDFQLLRYCPAAQDLVSFIYLTTDRSLRKKHFVDLIEIYYRELSKNIRIYGHNIENVIYPYENFIKSIEYMIPQAVCQTCIYFQLTLLNSDIIKEYMSTDESSRRILLIDRKDFLTDMYKRDALFRKRAGECIQDFREMCVKYF